MVILLPKGDDEDRAECSSPVATLVADDEDVVVPTSVCLYRGSAIYC